MSHHEQRDGEWLSAPGEYRQLIHDLYAADPRLRRRDPKAFRQHVPWPTAQGRVVLLEGLPQTDGSTSFSQPREYNTPESLKDHFARRSAEDDIPRVYILESQNPDFIAAIGEYFRVHPPFSVEHERVEVIGHGMERASDSMLLPSLAVTRQHFTLSISNCSIFRKAFAILSGYNVQSAAAISGCRDPLGPSCIRESRVGNVLSGKGKTSPGGHGIVTSSRIPSKFVIKDKKTNHKVFALPYRGGYVDFIPAEEQMEVRLGPSRVSLLDDLCFYLTNYPSLKDPLDPRCAALLAKEIAASYYHQLVEFQRSLISNIQWSMLRQEKLDIFDISSVEAQWSDVQALERRISEYLEDLEAAMIQCHISLDEPDANKINDWKDTATDFQFLYMRFKDIRHRAEGLNSAITALMSLAGNKKGLKDQELSLKEARNAKALSFLGLIFIPLAYTTSLFSMTEPYGPGGDNFWLYFAISFPVTLIVICAYFLINLTASLTHMKSPMHDVAVALFEDAHLKRLGGHQAKLGH